MVEPISDLLDIIQALVRRVYEDAEVIDSIAVGIDDSRPGFGCGLKLVNRPFALEHGDLGDHQASVRGALPLVRPPTPRNLGAPRQYLFPLREALH